MASNKEVDQHDLSLEQLRETFDDADAFWRSYDVVASAPYEQRVRKQERGLYFIAPDSAEPIPQSIWQRIDLRDLLRATKRANEQLRTELTLEERERPNQPLPLNGYMPKDAREFLAELGTDSALEILNSASSLSDEDLAEAVEIPSRRLLFRRMRR
jgi:hypothetical protein